MNNLRRNKIKSLIKQAELLKVNIENVLDEEQDYYDNMPENLQGGDNGLKSEDAITELEESISCLESVIEGLENAKL